MSRNNESNIAKESQPIKQSSERGFRSYQIISIPCFEGRQIRKFTDKFYAATFGTECKLVAVSKSILSLIVFLRSIIEELKHHLLEKGVGMDPTNGLKLTQSSQMQMIRDRASR